MTGRDAPTIHAGAARIDGTGVLVRGASGSGKSSLILALLMADRMANQLIADDRVFLMADGGLLHAAVPDEIAGLLEIRGQGIVRLPYVSPEPVGLVVDLVSPERVARMPVPEERETVIEGIRVPRLALPAGQADGWIRVRAALATWVAEPGLHPL